VDSGTETYTKKGEEDFIFYQTKDSILFPPVLSNKSSTGDGNCNFQAALLFIQNFLVVLKVFSFPEGKCLMDILKASNT
jgi:hypothetical protein